MSSPNILRLCFIGTLGGAVLLIFAGSLRSPRLLWGCTALLGAFCGPMWPAMQAIPVERYGIEVQATHYAFVLTAAKIGIAVEQMLFSKLLARKATAHFTTWAVFGLIVCVSAWFSMLHECVVPKLGLQQLDTGLRLAKNAPPPVDGGFHGSVQSEAHRHNRRGSPAAQTLSRLQEHKEQLLSQTK
jgi:MFS family permease